MQCIEKSTIWNDSLERAITFIDEIRMLRGKRVFITGASGLICSAIIDLILAYNKSLSSNKIEVFAAGRDYQKIKTRFCVLADECFHFIQYDATKTDNRIPESIDYIIHGASNAFPNIVIKEPVETILSNVLGMHELLQIARKSSTKRVLYISSSEIYGIKNDDKPYKENEYGFIDLLNPRNSYAYGKRAAESLCASFAAEYGIEYIIARPGHVYGPTASINDTRVSSSFAWAAAKGENLVLKSAGNQIRSYCHCIDCATAILKLLLKGEKNSAYNISNPQSVISIREMAEIIAKTSGVKLLCEVASTDDKRVFNPMNNSSLNAQKLMELEWKCMYSAEEGFRETIHALRELIKEE